jgi:Rod binding domain-containing protein
MMAGRTGAAGKSAEAFRQFESFVLQSFIETMLPKNAESVFGKGTAGGIWKSMLAEKLADQISRNGGVGIAQRIAASPGAHALPASGETTAHPAPIAALAGISHQSIAKPGDDV